MIDFFACSTAFVFYWLQQFMAATVIYVSKNISFRATNRGGKFYRFRVPRTQANRFVPRTEAVNFITFLYHERRRMRMSRIFLLFGSFIYYL